MKRAGFAVLLLFLCPLWNTRGGQSGASKVSIQVGEHVQPPQPLTNESIIGLVKIGLSDETIISTIQHELGNYSLRTDDVIALKKASVSEGVIGAMSSKMGIGPTPAPTAPAAVAPPAATEMKREPGQGAKEKDQPARPLTNESIVKLVTAGLGEDTIIKMVDSQPGQYSQGADDIIALKKAGVSEKIITAMLTKPTNELAPAPVTPPRASENQAQPPQVAALPSASAASADTASSAFSNARVRYDKFKDATTVKSRTYKWALGKIGLLGGGELDFQYQCPGQATKCQTEGVIVTFTRHGRGWVLMYGLKEIIFLADGHRVAARDVAWNGLTDIDGVMEYFTGTLSPDDFHSIATAQDVEIEVGGSSSFTKRFKAKDIEDWREFGLSIGKTE